MLMAEQMSFILEDIHRIVSSPVAGVETIDVTRKVEKSFVTEPHVLQDQWILFVMMQLQCCFTHLPLAIIVLRFQHLNHQDLVQLLLEITLQNLLLRNHTNV